LVLTTHQSENLPARPWLEIGGIALFVTARLPLKSIA
jgi:hypothetical protein